MYQMMIIDDEQIVREGLMHLLPWEDYKFNICAEGTDGIDGLEKLLRYQPELVLVDVKMPGINGLELIKRAREQGYEGNFIILTGYSDFEFAKTAITLGVKDYLLKPIDEDELAGNLIKIANELDEKKHKNKHMELSEQGAKQEMLRRLLFYVEDKDILHEQINSYALNFNYTSFCVAILSNESPDTNGVIEYPSKEKLAIMLKGFQDIEKVTIEDKWVLICKGRGYKECLSQFMLNNECLTKLYGEKYFIAMGHDVSHWEDLHYSYECAKLLLDYQFIYQNEKSVSINALEQSRKMTLDNLYEQIYFQIEIGDLDELTASFVMIEEYCKLKLLKESEVKIYLLRNIFLLKELLDERFPDSREKFPKYQELETIINSGKNLNTLLDTIKVYCKQISSIIGFSGGDNVIKRINAYIERNYQKDLKLESIAKLFNYNSAYLGKLFKKEMGESFNNFIDHIRIEKAKQMLIETNLKVYQVSEKVGYSNIDYFYSKFKRYVGVSPKEFKKTI